MSDCIRAAIDMDSFLDRGLAFKKETSIKSHYSIVGSGTIISNYPFFADAINEKVDLENDDYGIKDLIAKRQAIIDDIEKLSLDEYEVIYMRYVYNMEYQDIADSCDKSYSWATSVHGRALKNIEKIRSEKIEKCN